MTPRDTLKQSWLHLLRTFVLILAYLASVQLALVEFHAPGWTAIALLIVFASVGSYLEWLDRRRGKR